MNLKDDQGKKQKIEDERSQGDLVAFAIRDDCEKDPSYAGDHMETYGQATENQRPGEAHPRSSKLEPPRAHGLRRVRLKRLVLRPDEAIDCACSDAHRARLRLEQGGWYDATFGDPLVDRRDISRAVLLAIRSVNEIAQAYLVYAHNEPVVVGVGIDLVDIARIAHAMRNPRFVPKVLTEREEAYCRNAQQVAGRWAAKEAVIKAVGIPLLMRNIEILNDPLGQPHVVIRDHRFDSARLRVFVSLTHEKTHAAGVAVVERVVLQVPF